MFILRLIIPSLTVTVLIAFQSTKQVIEIYSRKFTQDSHFGFPADRYYTVDYPRVHAVHASSRLVTHGFLSEELGSGEELGGGKAAKSLIRPVL